MTSRSRSHTERIIKEQLVSYLNQLPQDVLRRTSRKQCRTYMEQQLNRELYSFKDHIKAVLNGYILTLRQRGRVLSQQQGTPCPLSDNTKAAINTPLGHELEEQVVSSRKRKAVSSPTECPLPAKRARISAQTETETETAEDELAALHQSLESELMRIVGAKQQQEGKLREEHRRQLETLRASAEAGSCAAALVQTHVDGLHAIRRKYARKVQKVLKRNTAEHVALQIGVYEQLVGPLDSVKATAESKERKPSGSDNNGTAEQREGDEESLSDSLCARDAAEDEKADTDVEIIANPKAQHF